MSKNQILIHRSLCVLILSVILEGVVRKLVPQAVGVLIFFLKDLLTIFLLLLCLKGKPNAEALRWLGIMRVLVVLLLPCILLTAIHDPVLAAFGIKQYVLFPTVVIAMCMAYLPNHRRQLFQFFRIMAYSLLLTSCVAVAQNRLPASNWLNLSVAGDDLSGFSAAGYLRVSSTFPFVAQYCYYLNAICFCLPAFLYFAHIFRLRAVPAQFVALNVLFIFGTFVTGSRSAVVGNAVILILAGVFAGIFAGTKVLVKLLAIAAIGGVLFVILRSQAPQLFAAYQARSAGTAEESQSIEIKNRLEHDLFGWADGLETAPPTLFGYGLGVMSNGSEKLSTYAAGWRAGGFWTESDQATTLFEGGWYLVVVWYGFRFWIIFQCISLVSKIRHLHSRLAASFALGFILITGIMGTLAIQPPLAIWFWLAVGLITCLAKFDGQQPPRARFGEAVAKKAAGLSARPKWPPAGMPPGLSGVTKNQRSQPTIWS